MDNRGGERRLGPYPLHTAPSCSLASADAWPRRPSARYTHELQRGRPCDDDEQLLLNNRAVLATQIRPIFGRAYRTSRADSRWAGRGNQLPEVTGTARLATAASGSR